MDLAMNKSRRPGDVEPCYIYVTGRTDGVMDGLRM